MLADIAFIGKSFRGHVGCADIFHKAVNMSRGRHLTRGTGRGAAAPVPDLPVEHFDTRATTVWCGDQGTLRTQTAVDNLLIVGEADYFGDLPDEIQTQVHVEGVFALREIMVEANRAWIMLENDRWP